MKSPILFMALACLLAPCVANAQVGTCWECNDARTMCEGALNGSGNCAQSSGGCDMYGGSCHVQMNPVAVAPDGSLHSRTLEELANVLSVSSPRVGVNAFAMYTHSRTVRGCQGQILAQFYDRRAIAAIRKRTHVVSL